MGRAFLQTKFFQIGPKKIFQIGPTVLALKLDKGRVLGGGGGEGNHSHIEQKLTYVSNHEDDIQS